MKPKYVTKAMIGKIRDALKDYPRELQWLEMLVDARDKAVLEKLEIILRRQEGL